MQNNQTQTHPLKEQSRQKIKQKPRLLNEKYNKNYSKQEIALIFSYLNGNGYFQNLKKQHKYVHWMSTQQKRNLLVQSYTCLVKSKISQQIESIKNQTASNHQLQNINIVVMILYGKLHFKGQPLNIGQWIEVSDSLDSLVEEKCVCLLFQKSIFQAKIKQLNFFHFKKMFIKRYFLEKIGIQIPSKKVDQIVDLLEHRQYTQKAQIDHNKHEYLTSGIYILIKGSFFVYSLDWKVCISQISQSYFGEESFWCGFKYNLKAKENDTQILFCSRQTFVLCLSQQKNTQLKIKLKQLYEKRRLIRKEVKNAIQNLHQQLDDSKEKALKKIKSRINIEQCQKTLQSMRNMKPKWQTQEQIKQKKTENKRKNIFTQPSQSEVASSRKKYFSVKITKSSRKVVGVPTSAQIEDKKILKRHFSQKKVHCRSTMAATPFTLTRTNNLIDASMTSLSFSKFARTSFFKQGNLTAKSQFLTPKKVKSAAKLDKQKTEAQDRINNWDVEYSKKYDRCLSWSIKKEKNLNKVVKFKQKVFPKQRAHFFTMEDAKQASNISFYQLEKLRRQEAEQKNKRTFQKVFKHKLLLIDASRKTPFTFR